MTRPHGLLHTCEGSAMAYEPLQLVIECRRCHSIHRFWRIPTVRGVMVWCERCGTIEAYGVSLMSFDGATQHALVRMRPEEGSDTR